MGPGLVARSAAGQTHSDSPWREPGLLAVMVAATTGGFWGARWSKRMPVLWVRRSDIATGLVMSAVLFARAIG